MDNIKTITIGIVSNKRTNLKSHNGTYKIFLNPISLTLQSFKNAFYPCNYFTPNEFVDITQFNYYTVRNTICTKLTDCSTNYVDCSASFLDCSGTMHRKFKNEPLCLYTQTLAKFMEYNGILCESTIDPRYMISFTNEIFKYTNFTTIPKVVSTMSWTNILNWIYIQLNKQCNICLRIELHYYDEQFMPYPVIYVFQYNIY